MTLDWVPATDRPRPAGRSGGTCRAATLDGRARSPRSTPSWPTRPRSASATACALDESANCVVVAAKRGGETRYAACMVLATTRADVNGVVRRHLDARKASFAPMDEAVGLTGMEYGGITPVGLPDGLADPGRRGGRRAPGVVIGSGRAPLQTRRFPEPRWPG